MFKRKQRPDLITILVEYRFGSFFLWGRRSTLFVALCHSFGISYTQLLTDDTVDNDLLLCFIQSYQHFGMPLGDLAFCDLLLSIAGEAQKTQGIGDLRTALVDDRRELIMGNIVYFDQLCIGACQLNGIEVFSLDIFDECQLTHPDIIDLDICNDRLDRLDICKLVCPQSPLTGNQKIAVLFAYNHNGL